MVAKLREIVAALLKAAPDREGDSKRNSKTTYFPPFPASFQKKQSPEVFCKKGVLRNFTKFTGKHLCQSLFLNKVAGIGAFLWLLWNF